MYILALADWDEVESYSLGLAVLAYLYRTISSMRPVGVEGRTLISGVASTFYLYVQQLVSIFCFIYFRTMMTHVTCIDFVRLASDAALSW
jgi:hypothetical protein